MSRALATTHTLPNPIPTTPSRRVDKDCFSFSFCSVCPEGAYHQWREIPPRELSIDLVADERSDRATGRAGAS